MFLVLMDATVLPFQLTFKSNFDPDDFDAAWLWITTLIFGIDVVPERREKKEHLFGARDNDRGRFGAGNVTSFWMFGGP